MNEVLKKSYEEASMDTAIETVNALVNGNNLEEVKSFAINTIDDWKREGKDNLASDFKQWLQDHKIEIFN